MMTPREKATELYATAYQRWCYEISHEKNVLTAVDIAIYVCDQVLGFMGADRGYEFWTSVRHCLKTGDYDKR